MGQAWVTSERYLSIGATLLQGGQLKDKGSRDESGFACVSEVHPQKAGFHTPFLKHSRCSAQGVVIATPEGFAF